MLQFTAIRCGPATIRIKLLSARPSDPGIFLHPPPPALLTPSPSPTFTTRTSPRLPLRCLRALSRTAGKDKARQAVSQSTVSQAIHICHTSIYLSTQLFPSTY